VEALIVALENVGATMDNLNQAAARVNRLLDDVEDSDSPYCRHG